MISTTWTDAPAGLSARAAPVRPRTPASVVDGVARSVMAPVAAPSRGPVCPSAARLRPIDERGVVHESFLQAHVVASPRPPALTR